MKKILAVILFCMVLFFLQALAECDNHDWSNKDGICAVCSWECNHPDWENGECIVCGFANPCQHVRDCTGDICLDCGEYYVGDNVIHYAYCYDCICIFCGEEVEPTRHSRYCTSNTCIECGAPCSEENADTEHDMAYRSYESLNAETHNVSCSACGASWTSGHYRCCNGSTCIQCGAAYTGDTWYHYCELNGPIFKPVINSDGSSTLHALFCACGQNMTAEYGLIGGETHNEVILQGHAATCSEDGLTDGKYCDYCNYTYEAQTVIPALSHTPVIDKGYAATCTKDGLTDGTHCSVCNTILTEQAVIPTVGHTVVTDKGYAATCTKDGLTDGTHCSVCNTVLTEQTVIPAIGHTVVTDKGYTATCKKDGLSDGSHCSVCNTVIEEQKVIPATGHTEVRDKGYAATCTRDGKTEGSHCSTCGKVINAQETLKAKGHVFDDPLITPASCETDGLSIMTCKVCGFSEETVLPAIGHSYSSTYTNMNNRTHGAPCEHNGCNSIDIKPCELIETVVGNIRIQSCPVCGYSISEVVETPSNKTSDAIGQTIQNNISSAIPGDTAEGNTGLENIQFISESKVEKTVIIPSDNSDEQSVTLIVYEQQALSDTLEAALPLHVYSLVLVSNGAAVDLTGSIQVEIPFEEGEEEMLKDMILVAVMPNGTLKQIKFELVDGKIVFDTDVTGTIAFIDASLFDNHD